MGRRRRRPVPLQHTRRRAGRTSFREAWHATGGWVGWLSVLLILLWVGAVVAFPFAKADPTIPRWILRWWTFTVLAGAVCIIVAGIIGGVRKHRLERRRAAGLCPACGYDLRATPDGCPECGAVPPTTNPSPPGVE